MMDLENPETVKWLILRAANFGNLVVLAVIFRNWIVTRQYPHPVLSVIGLFSFVLVVLT